MTFSQAPSTVGHICYPQVSRFGSFPRRIELVQCLRQCAVTSHSDNGYMGGLVVGGGGGVERVLAGGPFQLFAIRHCAQDSHLGHTERCFNFSLRFWPNTKVLSTFLVLLLITFRALNPQLIELWRGIFKTCVYQCLSTQYCLYSFRLIQWNSFVLPG